MRTGCILAAAVMLAALGAPARAELNEARLDRSGTVHRLFLAFDSVPSQARLVEGESGVVLELGGVTSPPRVIDMALHP